MMNPRTIAACVLAVAVIAVTAITAMDIVKGTVDDTDKHQSGVAEHSDPTLVEQRSDVGNDQQQAFAATQTTTSINDSSDTASDEVDMNSPEVMEYQRFENFRTQTRNYFANAANIAQPQRSNLAVALLSSVQWAESEDYLLPVEALTLKLGLLQTTVTDENVFKEVALDLANSYKEKAKALEASIVPDPRHGQYEVEQAKIVQEVLESTRNADAAMRQKLLRERLTELRTQIYTKSSVPGSQSIEN